ncbi:MAG TPA: BrnT family toxin [Bryobacteraceae bacterium]|nr:BrnT family toxin [Bryobacteraceae bacterium]
MEFTWDETKREWVLKERGIDFLRIAVELFDGRAVLSVPTRRGDEERFLTIGPIEGRLFAVVWTWRDATIRIITARRASDEEEKRYRAVFG